MKAFLYGSDAVIFARSGRFPQTFGKRPVSIPRDHVPELTTDNVEYLQTHFGISSPAHVAVAEAICRRKSKSVWSHCHGDSLPRDGYLQIGKNLYCACPELAIAQFASQLAQSCMSRTSSVILLMLTITELASNYCLDERSKDGFEECAQRLTLKRLAGLIKASGRFQGKGLLREAFQLSYEGSRSPAETSLVAFAGLPQECGGRGIPSLVMNSEVKTTSGLESHVRIPDIRNEQHKVILEYNGSYHEGERANEDDNRRNELIAKGYRVLVINKDKLCNAVALESDLDTAAALTFASPKKATGYEENRALLRALAFEFSNTRVKENTGKMIPSEFKPAWFTRDRRAVH